MLPVAAEPLVSFKAGATSADDGGEEPAVVVAEELVSGVVGGVAAGAPAGLFSANVAGACSVDEGATGRGAGAADVMTGAVVVATVGVGVWGACVSGGASTVSSNVGSVTGTLGGVSGLSASAVFVCSEMTNSGSGTATVVVGTSGSVVGSANAGVIPPVSAVMEMITPDAKTATTLRLEQDSSCARIVHRLLWDLKERGGYRHGCVSSHLPQRRPGTS